MFWVSKTSFPISKKAFGFRNELLVSQTSFLGFQNELLVSKTSFLGFQNELCCFQNVGFQNELSWFPKRAFLVSKTSFPSFQIELLVSKTSFLVSKSSFWFPKRAFGFQIELSSSLKTRLFSLNKPWCETKTMPWCQVLSITPPVPKDTLVLTEQTLV